MGGLKFGPRSELGLGLRLVLAYNWPVLGSGRAGFLARPKNIG